LPERSAKPQPVYPGDNPFIKEETMTVKAAIKKVIKPGSVSVTGNAPQTAQGDYKLIPLKDLQTSPSNPRRRIIESTIESLAASIRTQGILEPLIIRESGKKYEIVCGERRYRAAKVARVTGIPCLVRKLSDAQVLDIQIHENLHREDVHPMDEAYGYKFLKEKLGCGVSELALRVGKTEGYVLNRLKLNLLIKEAQKDVDDEHLPLVYALEIAKYSPEIQKILHGEVFRKEGKYEKGSYVLVSLKEQTVPLKAFIEWINTNIHRRLSLAPFDPKATNLRSDGLACTKCPDRTGAAVSLFEPSQIGKKDACLNPACYLQKLEKYVQVRRLELAEIRNVESSEVPLVRSFCYPDGEGFLGTESATVIDAKRSGSTRNCKYAISGIDIEPAEYGRTVQVCLKTSGCKIHWPNPKISSNGNSSNGKSEEKEAADRLVAHRSRREEIWNAKVAEAVRVRVFKHAAEKFEKKFSIAEVGTDFLAQLIARFWRMSVLGDSTNLNNVVKYLIAEWEGKSVKSNEPYPLEGKNAVESFKKLERGILFRILFLLIHGHKGTIGYSNSYTSQKEVRDLAAEFNVDYSLLDAEVRLDLCSKKHKQAHQIYLDAIRGKKKNAKVPQLFSDKWRAKE
jgi:ParB family transcriptional regulator, chromosome partitioning protein